MERVEDIATSKYFRGSESVPLPNLRRERTFKRVRNRTLRKELFHNEADLKESIVSAARAEILQPKHVTGFMEPEEEEEKTYEVTQRELLKHADLNTHAKMLDLKFMKGSRSGKKPGSGLLGADGVGNLYGPYCVDYTTNGRHLAFGGWNTGHICVMDCLRNTPCFEIFVKETVRDVCFLHSEKFLAVAQKKYLYIYDDTGMEVHRLKKHEFITSLEFLRYHFMLASVNKYGLLVYQDTSTGEVAAEVKTKRGKPNGMSQNKSNAIIGLAHKSGAVTMWSPNQQKPLVEMFCHQGGVIDLAFDLEGNHLVTCGGNQQINIYDIRNTSRPSSFHRLHGYRTDRVPYNLSLSQTGLLSLNCGNVVKIWKDAIHTRNKQPYLVHELLGHQIVEAKFRPYEDVLCVGYDAGVKTIVVPGAGIANFDTFEANPFETRKQLREREVKKVLEKLQPNMITLNSNAIAKLSTQATLEKEDTQEAVESEDSESDTDSESGVGLGAKKRHQATKAQKPKRKMKGRGKIGSRLRAKSQQRAEQERAKTKEREDKEPDAALEGDHPTNPPFSTTVKSSLARFRRQPPK